MGLRLFAFGALIAAAAAACTPAKAGSGTTPARVPLAETTGGATSMGCGCLAVAGEVAVSVMADVARADLLYVNGDFDGALELYARAYGVSKDAVLLYAQGMVKWQLGAMAEARALLEQYVSVGGTFKARAEVAIRDIDGGVTAAVGAAVGAGGAVAGGVRGAAGGALGVVGGVTAKPKRVAGTAGIVLGVVAVAAIGAVGIHMISAGIKDDIELDAKFDAGLGITGVVVGATAVYVYGLTAASATVAAACAARIAQAPVIPPRTPIVAPVALPGGGGLAALVTF